VELLSEREFPSLYLAANRSAQAGQRRYLRASRLRLAALVAATAFGTVTLAVGRLDLAGVGGAAALGIAIVVEVYLLTVRPERQWYDARAAAESAKTLAWRYVVAGQPFGRAGASEREVDKLLLSRMREITRSVNGFALVPLSDSDTQISVAMREVRALPLTDRQQHYRRGRIQDQQAWYTNKAAFNERRSSQWSLFLAVLEALGLVAAVLRAAGVVGIDWAAIAAALAAAGVAWLQTKQHQTLATAYGIAAQELADVASQPEWPDSEEGWAHFVDEAEEAISREHTLWCASRA
jgi:hypothetical protein